MPQEPVIVRHGEAETLVSAGGELRFLCSGEETGGTWSLMENIVPFRIGAPPHFHAWDEAYYLISGEVEFEIDGKWTTARAGDFVYAPGGKVHAFRGASEVSARMLIIDVPAHAEGFFKDVHREVRDMPRDLGKLLAIGAAHGVHMIPPAET